MDKLGVKIGDVTVTRVTLHNAKTVELNSLGPGSVIKVRRSGDVIPFLVEVVKKASKPSMPDPLKYGDMKWSKNRVDLVLTKPTQNMDFRIRRITRFMTEVGVDFMKEGNVRKLHDAGFDNLTRLLRASPKDFLKVPGVKIATAEKLYDAIHRVLDRGIPIVKLMDASGTFPRGLGSTRFQQIADKYNMKAVIKSSTTHPEKVRKALHDLPGWSGTTVEAFIKGAPAFTKFLTVTGLSPIYFREKIPEAKTQKLKGMGFTWTGYRNGEEEQLVVENGGVIVPFGSKTKVLLYRPGGKSSSKLDKARAKGIVTVTWEVLAKKYKL
jgi:DNA ligase (NAD+)